MMNLYRIGGTKKIPENVDSITEVLLKYGHPFYDENAK